MCVTCVMYLKIVQKQHVCVMCVICVMYGTKFHSENFTPKTSKMTKFRSRTKMFEGTVHDSDKASLHSQANSKSANNQQS